MKQLFPIWQNNYKNLFYYLYYPMYAILYHIKYNNRISQEKHFYNNQFNCSFSIFL